MSEKVTGDREFCRKVPLPDFGPRREIEAVLGVQVYLDLRVKVRRRWRRDERYVERLL